MDPVSATVLIGAFIIIAGAILIALIVRGRECAEVITTYENADIEQRNTVAILAEERLALTILRPEAFTRPGGLDLFKSEMVPPGEALPFDKGGYFPAPIDREYMEKAQERLYAPYEPTGLVLHPRDFDHLDCVGKVENAAGEPGSPERVEMQKQIADAFGIPYWIAGVDGVKPPLMVRVRTFRRSLPGRGRRLLARLPLVYDYGYVARKGTWLYDGPTERRGRWWVQIGPLRIGWGWDEEDW